MNCSDFGVGQAGDSRDILLLGNQGYLSAVQTREYKVLLHNSGKAKVHTAHIVVIKLSAFL